MRPLRTLPHRLNQRRLDVVVWLIGFALLCVACGIIRNLFGCVLLVIGIGLTELARKPGHYRFPLLERWQRSRQSTEH